MQRSLAGLVSWPANERIAEDEADSRKRSRSPLPRTSSALKRSSTCDDLTDVKRIPALPLQRSGLSGNMDDLFTTWTFEDVGERAARRQRCGSPLRDISDGRVGEVSPDRAIPPPMTGPDCLKPCWTAAVRSDLSHLADRVPV